MPTYQYRCPQCGATSEEKMSMTEYEKNIRRRRDCVAGCHHGMSRIITVAPPVRFLGDGWPDKKAESE